MLICSIFAVPLAFFAIQLASSYHQQAHQAQITREGLHYIQKTSALIQALEQLRDIDVITSWRAYPAFTKQHTKNKEHVITQIDQLLNITLEKNNLYFLQNLKAVIKDDTITKGTVSASIDAVYDDAQILLEKTYNWQAKLSYNFISFSRNDDHILSIIKLLNETNIFSTAVGEIRSYGSVYLVQQFVDSHGVQVLEKAYQRLSYLIDVIDLKGSEYQTLIDAHPQTALTQIKQSLFEIREIFYQQLIVASKPTSNPKDFYDALGKSYSVIYRYNQDLFNLSSDIIEQDYQNSVSQLWVFYSSACLISALLIYLVSGVYHSISIAIRELRYSAAAFAAGKYDRPVKITSHDELTAVAEAMDSMRLNIKEREKKLALMGQTDGLTQLSNRKFFDQALQVGLANSRRNMTQLTIVMMDIDYFKKVNDEYGHLAGDDCLIEIAKLMKHYFKRKTDIVARYGGEEFIAILYGQGIEESVHQTEKLRTKIKETTINSGDLSFNVTASFGVTSLVPPEDACAQDLIALADALLYQSKDNGRDQVSAQKYSSQTPHSE